MSTTASLICNNALPLLRLITEVDGLLSQHTLTGKEDKLTVDIVEGGVQISIRGSRDGIMATERLPTHVYTTYNYILGRLEELNGLPVFLTDDPIDHPSQALHVEVIDGSIVVTYNPRRQNF